MTGLIFEERAPVVVSNPNRADIACFVGFVARRAQQASAATVTGNAITFPIPNVPEGIVLTVTVGGVGPQRILLPAEGDIDVATLVNALNDNNTGIVGATAYVNASRQLVVTSVARGGDASIAVLANPLLGFPRDVTQRGRGNEVAPNLGRWLEERGWTLPEYQRGSIVDLLDLPVPIDTWDDFDRLFAWEQRPINHAGDLGTTYLGAAVRSFFAQGGRKCYVVRVGDPWPLLTHTEVVGLAPLPDPVNLDSTNNTLPVTVDGRPQPPVTLLTGQYSPSELVRAINGALGQGYARLTPDNHLVIGSYLRSLRASVAVGPNGALGFPQDIRALGRELLDLRLGMLIPGYPHLLSSSPLDQRSWRGIGHLFGLPDVSFLCIPDLAEIVGMDESQLDLAEPVVVHEQQFVECSAPEPDQSRSNLARLIRTPRCDEAGYQSWAQAIRLTAHLITRRQQQREVQFIAAVPIPERGTRAEGDLYGAMIDQGQGPLGQSLKDTLAGMSSAFIQLVYPWVRTPGSVRLPEQLESPDAVLAGVLARNALTQGTFRSAASTHLGDVYSIFPLLPRSQMRGQPSGATGGESRAANSNLLERVSLFGPTTSGLRLLSDVTTSLDPSYRPASVNRLVSVIVRASRELGEDIVFEASGTYLWDRLRDHLERLLLGLFQAGALRGQTPAQAFQVRCDRSTMSQNDIDNGRVIAEITFQPAVGIEEITVALAMDEGGHLSLASNSSTREA